MKRTFSHSTSCWRRKQLVEITANVTAGGLSIRRLCPTERLVFSPGFALVRTAVSDQQRSISGAFIGWQFVLSDTFETRGVTHGL
jgi:hypothetical protein